MRWFAGPIVIALLVILVVLTALSIVGTPGPSARDRDVWDYAEKVGGPLVGALAAIVALIFTLRWNAHSARMTYFTKEWSTLMQFLQGKAEFMDPDHARNYRTHFQPRKMEYELVARLCIGYVDDLYFLGGRDLVRNWFRGSVKFLVGTHRAWFEDHRDAYDANFYDFVIAELDRR